MHKKSRIYFFLMLGLIWVSLAILNFSLGNPNEWVAYVYLLCSIIYLAQFFYTKTYPYVTIENGSIRKNVMFRNEKLIYIKEILSIKRFAGDYTFKTATDEIIIHTQAIDKNSLAQLDSFLEELNMIVNTTPLNNPDYP